MEFTKVGKKRVLLLIDGDMIAFSHCAAEEYGKESEDISFAKIQMSMDSKMEFLSKRLGATDIITFISGDENMRHVIFPEYKANRDGVWRPENLKNAKAHLMVAWNGMRMEGLEADDLLACFARHEFDVDMGKLNRIKTLTRIRPCTYDEVIIASLDKDLRQVSQMNGVGPVIKHYQWERESQGIGEKIVIPKDYGELKCIIKDTGKTKKKEVKGDGPKFFLHQLLIGDSTDGVLGCGVRELKVYKSGAKCGEEYYKRDGIGAVESFEILDKTTTYPEGLKKVIGAYIARFGDSWEEELLKNGRLVYMHHMIEQGRYVRLWHYNGAVADYFDLKEQRVVPHEEYLQK